MKKPLAQLLKPKNITTCEVASVLCREVGARILWRPGGVVNWHLPAFDAAEIIED